MTPLPPPIGWVVETPNTMPALFLDHGRALAYAARFGGVIDALYAGRSLGLPTIPQPQPVTRSAT